MDYEPSAHGTTEYNLLCFKESQLRPLEVGSELHEQRARERMAGIAQFSGLPTREEREVIPGP